MAEDVDGAGDEEVAAVTAAAVAASTCKQTAVDERS